METGITERIAEYLEKRQIPVELASRLGVCSWESNLAFEYRKDGRLQYRKFRYVRDGEKSFGRDRKGAETCMFLEHQIQDDPELSCPLIVTEGEIDALSIASVGLPNVVSVPDGAQLDDEGPAQIDPTSDKAFGWMWDGPNLKKHLAQFDRVILACDGDRKGRILTGELSVRFGAYKCYWIDYPSGCKDANDVLMKHGAAKLEEIIKAAKPIIPDKLVRFADIPDFGTGELYTSGLKGLDEGLGFGMMATNLVVFTGEPGSGKSELATNVGANLANLHQLPGAIIQFEDSTTRVRDTLISYALSSVSGITNRGEAFDWVNKWFRTIVPQQGLGEDDDYTLPWLEYVIREARTRHGCKWVILDPWNEMEHMWDKGQNEAKYMNDALRRIKRIAKAFQIIIMVVAHPTKEGGKIKEIEELDLYMMAGGAAWSNKADIGIIVHRPEKDKTAAYIKVSKTKNQLLYGRPGIVRVEYQIASAKYRYIGMGK